MRDRNPRLHMTGRSDGGSPCCRAIGCDLPGSGDLGFCRACEAVYRAALELRERVLEARAARMAAAHPGLFAGLTPEHRAALLGHLAARAQDTRLPGATGLDLAALEDFLEELLESGGGP
jgi:hypothetical protein